jgi:hypothetical protein
MGPRASSCRSVVLSLGLATLVLKLKSLQDFTEVDHNVTRHVPTELAQGDWSALIMHYLGLDHIGHKAGPKRYLPILTPLYLITNPLSVPS